MQNAVLGNEYKYDLTAPKFQTAFAFLKRTDLAELAEGWYELENGVRASVQRYTTFPASELVFETHVDYFDVQYMVSGKEMIGVVNAKGPVSKVPYDKADDIEFYHEPAFSGMVFLRAGAPMAVNKIVVKVPV